MASLTISVVSSNDNDISSSKTSVLSNLPISSDRQNFYSLRVGRYLAARKRACRDLRKARFFKRTYYKIKRVYILDMAFVPLLVKVALLGKNGKIHLNMSVYKPVKPQIRHIVVVFGKHIVADDISQFVFRGKIEKQYAARF